MLDVKATLNQLEPGQFAVSVAKHIGSDRELRVLELTVSPEDLDPDNYPDGELIDALAKVCDYYYKGPQVLVERDAVVWEPRT